MTSEAITENNYRAAFRSLHNELAPSWLSRLRERAMDRFDEAGFPLVSEEEWKYTNVASIARQNFRTVEPRSQQDYTDQTVADFIYAEAGGYLVFVNGEVRRDLSHLPEAASGISILTFNEALEHEAHSEILREYVGRVVDYSENGFTALNTALFPEGALILIGRNAQLTAPLQLIYLTDQESSAVFPRVLLVAEENSVATVIESYERLSGLTTFTDVVIEIVVKDGARLNHYRVQNESTNVYHVTTSQAELGRDSSFDSTNITLGAKLSRHNVRVIMNAEGGECRVDGLYVVGEEQHTDTHSVIDHRLARCTSRQLYKGILDGKARAVFNGKVFVRHGAAGTDAQQTNKNLLLSNEAHVDTKPQLEIYADDVKCAHGAAIGQLDADELFYLESRGIHVELARNLLTYGFAEEVISKIAIESIKTQLDETVLNRLHTQLEA